MDIIWVRKILYNYKHEIKGTQYHYWKDAELEPIRKQILSVERTLQQFDLMKIEEKCEEFLKNSSDCSKILLFECAKFLDAIQSQKELWSQLNKKYPSKLIEVQAIIYGNAKIRFGVDLLELYKNYLVAVQLQRAEKSYQQLLQENTDITQDFNRLSKEKKKKEKELTNKILLLETQVEQLEEKNRELENAKKPQEITDPKSCQFNKRSSESLSKQVTGLKNKKVEGEKQHNVPKLFYTMTPEVMKFDDEIDECFNSIHSTNMKGVEFVKLSENTTNISTTLPTPLSTSSFTIHFDLVDDRMREVEKKYSQAQSLLKSTNNNCVWVFICFKPQQNVEATKIQNTLKNFPSGFTVNGNDTFHQCYLTFEYIVDSRAKDKYGNFKHVLNDKQQFIQTIQEIVECKMMNKSFPGNNRCVHHEKIMKISEINFTLPQVTVQPQYIVDSHSTVIQHNTGNQSADKQPHRNIGVNGLATKLNQVVEGSGCKPVGDEEKLINNETVAKASEEISSNSSFSNEQKPKTNCSVDRNTDNVGTPTPTQEQSQEGNDKQLSSAEETSIGGESANVTEKKPISQNVVDGSNNKPHNVTPLDMEFIEVNGSILRVNIKQQYNDNVVHSIPLPKKYQSFVDRIKSHFNLPDTVNHGEDIEICYRDNSGDSIIITDDNDITDMITCLPEKEKNGFELSFSLKSC